MGIHVHAMQLPRPNDRWHGVGPSGGMKLFLCFCCLTDGIWGESQEGRDKQRDTELYYKVL